MRGISIRHKPHEAILKFYEDKGYNREDLYIIQHPESHRLSLVYGDNIISISSGIRDTNYKWTNPAIIKHMGGYLLYDHKFNNG